jgi:hypothetical protein
MRTLFRIIVLKSGKEWGIYDRFWTITKMYRIKKRDSLLRKLSKNPHRHVEAQSRHPVSSRNRVSLFSPIKVNK